MSITRFLTGFLIAPAISCATLEHGTVTKTVDVRDVKIELGGDDDVQPGDRVAFFNQECHEEPPFGVIPEDFEHEWSVCDKVKVGNGTITKVLDAHSSLVAVDPGVNVGYGALVQIEGGRTGRQAH